MQSVSTTWSGAVSAPFRSVNHDVMISWLKLTSNAYQYFKIGTSTIGGPDIIAGGGNSPALLDKYAYTSYGHYATGWNVERRLPQYPYGVILAQADVELDNSSKLFLPGFDGTIGSGILPYRPIKISAGVGAESFQQFVGLTGIPENTVGRTRQTTLHAYDAFDYINNFTSTASGTLTVSGVYTNLRSDQIIGDLLGEAGFTAAQYQLDPGLQTKIGFVAPANLKAGDIIRDLTEAEQGLSFADENGLIHFWNRQHFLTTSGTQLFNFSNIRELNYANAPIINDVKVVAKPRSVQVVQQVWNLSGTITLQPGVTTDYFVDFTDDFGALPVVAVVTPVPVSSTTATNPSSYSANTAADGSGTDLTGTSVTVVSTYNFGTTYRVSFSNGTANLAYITQMAIFGTPARVQQVIEQRYTDAQSVAIFGTNPQNNGQVLEIDNDYIQDSSQAASLAYTLVNEYSTPQRRYENTSVFSNPALQIGDIGVLVNRDNGETTSVYITGIRTAMSSDGNLEQFLDFEARTIKHYFTIGTSTIAGTDQIAP